MKCQHCKSEKQFLYSLEIVATATQRKQLSKDLCAHCFKKMFRETYRKDCQIHAQAKATEN